MKNLREARWFGRNAVLNKAGNMHIATSTLERRIIGSAQAVEAVDDELQPCVTTLHAA